MVRSHKTSNPFEICEEKSISIKYVNYGKAIIMNGYDKAIFINKKYDDVSRYILCAHELAHAILHENDVCNYFDEKKSLETMRKEEEANFFAAYLLFDDPNLDMKFENMNGYLLQNFIDSHLNTW